LYGEIVALITAFLWSGTSIAFTEASRRIGSIQLNVTRMILASIILTVIIYAAGFSVNINRIQLFYLVASGFVGLVFGDSFLFKSFQTIGARLGMIVMALVPAFGTLLAFLFLNESLSMVAIAGIVITSKSIYKFSKVGILFGVFGAIGQASGLVLAKAAFQIGDVNGFVATLIRLVAAIIIILPIVTVLKKYKNPIAVFKNDIRTLKLTLTGTVLGPVLGITASLIAIANAKIGIASTLMSTMPIIMLPLVKYYYKETLSWKAILGAFIAVAGVAILFLV
jgi:drug/metabolite transporter (DMT)-like permease